MPAAVLQMAVLAGARIEQRPEPVGGVGRGRRRDPVLAEDGVADLEVELALEVHDCRRRRRRRWRWSRSPCEVAPPPGLSSPSSILEKSVAGAVRPGTLASAPVPWLSAGAKNQRQARAKRNQRGKRALRGETGFGDAPHGAGTTRQRDLERFRCNRPTSEPDLVKNSWSNVPQTQPHSPPPAHLRPAHCRRAARCTGSQAATSSPWQAAWCSRSRAAPRNCARPASLNRCRSRAPDRRCRYRRSQWRRNRRAGCGIMPEKVMPPSA